MITSADLALPTRANADVDNLVAISDADFDDCGQPGPQAKGRNHLETTLRQLHAAHRASSCAKQGRHVLLCLKPRLARGIKRESFGSCISRSLYHNLRPRTVWVLNNKFQACGHLDDSGGTVQHSRLTLANCNRS